MNFPRSPSSHSSVGILETFELDNGEVIQAGDTVMVDEDEDDESFATVLFLWETGAQISAQIRWYYKPKDVFFTIPRFISHMELFDSDHEQSVPADSIKHKIEVLTLKAYFWTKEKSPRLRFCRAFYKPQELALEPEILQWEQMCTCSGTLNPDLSYLVCSECLSVFHHQCVTKRLNEVRWTCDACFKTKH